MIPGTIRNRAAAAFVILPDVALAGLWLPIFVLLAVLAALALIVGVLASVIGLEVFGRWVLDKFLTLLLLPGEASRAFCSSLFLRGPPK